MQSSPESRFPGLSFCRKNLIEVTANKAGEIPLQSVWNPSELLLQGEPVLYNGLILKVTVKLFYYCSHSDLTFQLLNLP